MSHIVHDLIARGEAGEPAAAPALRPAQGDEEEEAGDDGDGQHPRLL